MIRIADAMVAQLIVDATCVTKLGGRIFKDLIPTGSANPSASYTTVSDNPKDGMRTNRVASVQVKVYGETGSDASSAADAVISAIASDKYNPTLAVWTVGTDKHSVSLCLLTDCSPAMEPDTKLEVVLLQFEIHYTIGGS